MVKDRDHFHGSDLEKVEKIYGIKASDITSFAANVNPLGISPKLRQTLSEHIDAITTYPDREYTDLRTSIGNYINLDKDHIIVGNGSTELISLFIQITHPKKALLISPTYSEYERELKLSGGSLDYFFLKEEDNFECNLTCLEQKLQEGYDLLIICNPNNPTSSVIKRPQMQQLLEMTKQINQTRNYGTTQNSDSGLSPLYVMIDETYVEFAPNLDEVTAIPFIPSFDHLIVLRGVSKFFAAPGLRLGYAATSSAKLKEEILTKKNPWTINTLAAIAGEIMFSDEEYIHQTRTYIETQRDIVCNALRAHKELKIYEPYGNFVLVHILKEELTAADLFDAAIKKGLMIRDCVTFPGLDEHYFRICFMSEAKNQELLAIIDEFLA